MTDAVEDDLVRRTERLLEPGGIELAGVIVHTDLTGDDEIEMHDRSVAIGETIADHATDDGTDTYVHSGVDDPEFASNQHQGVTVADDEFVWECQQLLRKGSFDLVFYYRAAAHDAVCAALREAGHRITPVRPD
ncbi:hypothetical protein BRD17_06750 [Halobacteriales archaeon SW_7_68_16]|nr:MAG: hypothetical protein BRD17_06750 [Halobacteriales archaeon SW_7_68_16]